MNRQLLLLMILASASFFSSCDRSKANKPPSERAKPEKDVPPSERGPTITSHIRTLKSIDGVASTHKVVVVGNFGVTATRIADQSLVTIAPEALEELRLNHAQIVRRILERLAIGPGRDAPELRIELGIPGDALALNVTFGDKRAFRRVPPTDLPPELVTNFEHTLEATLRELID